MPQSLDTLKPQNGIEPTLALNPLGLGLGVLLCRLCYWGGGGM